MKFLSISMLITYLRVFHVSVISLPLSKVFEQKVYEINSLSYLNKIVKNFNNLDYIFQTIVELSSNSMRQSIAWIQTYNSLNLSSLQSSYTSNKDFSTKITDNKHLQDIIHKTHTPTIIPSITDVLQQNPLKKQETSIESLCIIPINFKENLIGHLIVANENSYFFDEDDLNLLITYVESLSIAIEGNYLLIEKIEKEKYKKELLMAKEIQNHFLPKNLPNLSNLEIEVLFKPSEEVGGDFYDFIRIDEHKLLVLIGDVSGKGMSAALYMALLKGIILSFNKNTSSL
ncbi:MAG: SpoIIE family protein phosphatase, partial [Candidatus Kapaibacteriota bacterium]